MTLRALWTYDHVANAGGLISLTGIAAYAANNSYNLLTGNPGSLITRSGTPTLSINTSNNATLPGMLSIANTTAAASGLAVALADIPLLQGGVTKAYFGFRTVATVIPTPGTASVVGVAASATAAPTALVNETQLNRTVNTPQYVEVMVDIQNNVYSAWVDGLQIINAAALATGWSYLVFGSNAVLTNSGIIGLRDFYFLDADATTPNTRLGPIQSALASIVAATAPNYTSSDSKTPLQDLTTAYSGAPTALPNLANAATNDPVTVSYSSTAQQGSVIIATQYKMAASVNAAAQMTVKLTNGSGNVTPPNYSFSDTTMDFGRDLAGIQQTDPSGNAWTVAGFNATQLIVQPQSIT